MRRRTLAFLALSPLVVVGMVAWGLTFRRQLGPRSFQTPLPGIALLFGAIILSGVSLVIMLRSPFRMPIGERLFRLVWLGPIGRGFLWFAGRGLTPQSPSSGSSAVMAAPGQSPSSGVRSPGVHAPDRIGSLEMRIAELERWRREG
jgi:hypothetical protein